MAVLDFDQRLKTGPLRGALPLSADVVNRRQYVRVYYPLDCPKKFLPELIIRYRVYQVLDISEKGIRFCVPHIGLMRDDQVNAVLRFIDGEVIEIDGEVVRRLYNQVALKLNKGIPYCRILSEQMRLRNLESNGLISYEDK